MAVAFVECRSFFLTHNDLLKRNIGKYIWQIIMVRINQRIINHNLIPLVMFVSHVKVPNKGVLFCL